MPSENFCNINNILSCFSVVNSELDILGFKPVLYEESNEKHCIINIVNTLWSLISSSKKQILRINELNEKLLNYNRQLISHEDAEKKCLRLLQTEKEKTANLEESLTKLTDNKEELISEMKDLKKEVTSIRLSMSGQQIQYENDMRRKDDIIEGLHSKLFNIIEKGNTQRSEKTSKEGKCEAAVDISVFRKYMVSLQNNIQLLLKENVNLRESIVHIHMMVLESNQIKTVKDRSEILFKLPYQNIVNEIEEDIKTILNTKNIN